MLASLPLMFRYWGTVAFTRGSNSNEAKIAKKVKKTAGLAWHPEELTIS